MLLTTIFAPVGNRRKIVLLAILAFIALC